MRTGIVGLGLRAGNVLKMIQKEMDDKEIPYKALAPTTRSNKFASSLGADGINAK